MKRAQGSVSGDVFELGCWQVAARACMSAGRAWYREAVPGPQNAGQGLKCASGCRHSLPMFAGRERPAKVSQRPLWVHFGPCNKLSLMFKIQYCQHFQP